MRLRCWLQRHHLAGIRSTVLRRHLCTGGLPSELNGSQCARRLQLQSQAQRHHFSVPRTSVFQRDLCANGLCSLSNWERWYQRGSRVHLPCRLQRQHFVDHASALFCRRVHRSPMPEQFDGRQSAQHRWVQLRGWIWWHHCCLRH